MLECTRMCHCPWCWINAAIQRPWNRLVELQYNFNSTCLHYKFATPSIYLLCTISKLVCPLLYRGNDAFNATLQNCFVIHASEHVHCQLLLYLHSVFCTQKGLIRTDGNITSIQEQPSSYWYEWLCFYVAFMWIISCINNRFYAANLS